MTETVRCPCCDQQMEIERHKPNSHWSLRQTLMIQRMRAGGIPSKVIGRLLGVTPGAIREFNRVAPRILVPSVSADRRDSV